MDRQGLLTLYSYNSYANKLVFEVVAQLSEAEFTGTMIPIYPSVRALLHHMLSVEAFFLASCRGEAHAFDPAALPAPADIQQAWEQLDRERQDYLAALTEAALAEELPIQLGGAPFRFTRWQMLLQAFIHSNHHRGELSVLLTHLGHPLPTLDIIVQFVQESGQSWPAA
jgi:uncharacterized damage-inducible protein DinB